MIRDLAHFLSLQYFLVSPDRKVRFVVALFLLGATLYVRYAFPLDSFAFQAALAILTVFLASTIVATIGRFFIITAYRRRTKLKAGTQDNFTLGIDAAAYILVFLATVGSVFPAFGIPFGAFLTSLSLTAVALVILLKDFLLNLVDGFRILFSRDFLIGDYVKTKNTPKGIITDITYRATTLRTEAGEIVYVPNTTLMSDETINFSKARRRITVPFTVDVKKLGTLAEFETYLRVRLTERVAWLKDSPPPRFVLTKLSNETVDYEVVVETDRYSFLREVTLKDVVYRTVLEGTREVPTPSLFGDAKKGE